jgi:hypothetical protein
LIARVSKNIIRQERDFPGARAHRKVACGTEATGPFVGNRENLRLASAVHW